MEFKPIDKANLQKGQILLAEPFMDDAYFRCKVILLCEHSEEGSFGFILNNYIDFDLAQIIDNIPSLNTRISIGGPVRNSNLYYIHTLGDQIEESIEIIPGVYFGGNFEILKNMLIQGAVCKQDVRFFVGYSSWAPNQLEDELEDNSWIITSCDKNLVMNSNLDNLWESIMNRMGEHRPLIARLPDGPSLN
ncbi:MAG TPA: YqgE/AlgH family protein [Flavobacteriales bacterium]